MNFNKPLATFLATTFVSTLIALAADQPTLAPAAPRPAAPADQPAPGGGGRGNFQGRGGGGAGGGGAMGGVLDNQQWQLFRESMQKDSDKVRALDEKLRAAQKELVQACVATTYDEKVVREKAEAVAKIQVEITMLRAQSLAVVAPTLKPEQKDQLLESRFAIMILTSGGFGGFDQGGGGPGRGGFGGGTQDRGNRTDRPQRGGR